ncbi:hypothetical protein TIFTF001_027431 [Ficus carica]|uniref:Uncharacterized protein n=1 Tax=Ficus carica TaxID=3494 RepID=A0AA88DND1_FICCA|nr:hypothetical protein TIFTF001_027431 [Ficus carica]
MRIGVFYGDGELADTQLHATPRHNFSVIVPRATTMTAATCDAHGLSRFVVDVSGEMALRYPRNR